MSNRIDSPESDTRERILLAATRHFADSGFSGASIRMITQDAGVNLAAINYHFGSKLELLKAVVRYHVGPVNEGRMERLELLRGKYQSQPIPAKELVEAMLRPMTRLIKSREGFEAASIMRFSGRLVVDSKELWREIIEENFEEVFYNFVFELSRTLHMLPQELIIQRWQLMIGTMVGVFASYPLSRRPFVNVPVLNFDELITQLRDFVVAGLTAPVSTDES